MARTSLLIVNGNTNRSLTLRLNDRARMLLHPEREIVSATALSGSNYITTRADAVIAAQAIVETIAAEMRRLSPRTYDACVLACFGEPGIGAAREIFPFPIIGMAEASILSALQLGERFAIVTVGERWPGMLRELMRQQGLGERCCGILGLAGHALDFVSQPTEARVAVREAVDRAVREHGADVVVIGGAALAGFADELQPSFDVPLICSFTAALAQAEALATIRCTALHAATHFPMHQPDQEAGQTGHYG
ncbi:aspartate/glutamate racemase family protein [Microvirga brassicacearum]|uniref:aspartate/glutamate racemase family protein n=1 Tax=Microvirga brassicacearum TaxID=2580413 RepID=UPI0019142004|nr:aspartate/glutamate racemase family protein [Microvirga brassicacearum]